MRKPAFSLLILIFLFSCNTEKKEEIDLFSLLPPSSTNIDFINQLTETEEQNIIQYLYFNNGAGVAAGDINNDGLTDIYFTSNQNPNKLFLNKGNLQFEDITKASGVSGSGDWKTGVTMADVNGDGYLDIYVCQVGKYKSLKGKNQLFINQGNLTFSEQAFEYGLDFQGFSTQAAFFDYDLDGDLDMYLLNHSVHSNRSYGNVSLRLDKDSLAGDRLYRNDDENGNRIFLDVTSEAGIFSSQIGYGLGISVCDINNDGLPDIYISNDFHENDYLYINNGNGTFSEKLTSFISHTSRSSMGNDAGDINNDGLLDIIVLDMLPDNEKIRKQSGGEDDYELAEIKLDFGYQHQFVRNTLQLNLGGGMFSETGRLAGVYSTDWSWSPLFCDVDNDGFKDLFITNGIYRRANDLDYIKFITGGNRYFPIKDNSKLSDRDLYEKMPLYPNINYIYRNNRDLTFTNMSGEWGFKTPSFSNGSAYADLDNDGDLDLIVNNINDNAYIYRNNADKLLNNNFLSVILIGKGLNTRGIGARLILYSNEGKQIVEQSPTRGFLSASSDVLHFGLGSAGIIDSLIVHWPDNSIQVLTDIPVNKTITLDIKDATKANTANIATNQTQKLFSSAILNGLEYKHKEDSYVDFNREKLIPHSLSAEGPPLVIGDINGDKLDDIFVGGAKGQASMIFIQQKGGVFKSLNLPVLNKERFTDDVNAAFFDGDGDGDTDIYIVRGGNEIPVGDMFLTDLLLINDGNGGFTKGALPFISHNGSCVKPCDFDNDGDTDLFVGSRSVPGAYGWSPDQFLLENDGKGNFTDVTDKRSIVIRTAGMVTDAEWVDYDNDGDMDLIVTGEWMNVTVFKNENGYFTDATNSSGLGETFGWWNCLEVIDIDKDGDMDIIGGNLGLNSILKASDKEPVEMYLNDFDNNGSLDQIICSYMNGISYPVASVDELAGQIAGLDKKYANYSDFGGKTVHEIFGKEVIEKSVLKKAQLFESCLFLNNSDGTFEISKLPVMVQLSPVRDIVARDIDGDENIDIIIAGNNYSVRPSYGRYDASYSLFLKGDKSHTFTPILPQESGLIIKGDSRNMGTIEISGKQFLIVTVNNAELQIFKLF